MKTKTAKKFDWDKFHHDLDFAMAQMITEVDGFYPSKAMLWDFLLFVLNKKENP